MKLSRASQGVLGLVLFGVWTSACGPSESGAETSSLPSEADAAVVDSRAPDAIDDAGLNDARADGPLDGDADAALSCNALANGAPLVLATAVAQSLPSGAGGTIADGTYHLTEVTYYLGPDSDAAGPALTETWRQTLAVVGGAFGGVYVRNKSAEQRISGVLSMSGTKLVFQETCPSPAARGPYEYTATGSDLVAFIPSDKRALHFTKQ